MAELGSSVPAVEGNPYAPPDALVDDVVPDGEMQLADRGTRLGAAIIDGIILIMLNGAFGLVIGVSQFSAGAQQISPGMQVLFAFSAIGFYLLVNGYLLAKNGQTVGKKLLNIKIVRSDGSKVGLGRIFGLRWLPFALAGFIPFVGPIISVINVLFIFRESRKCLHDNIADTVVIKA